MKKKYSDEIYSWKKIFVKSLATFFFIAFRNKFYILEKFCLHRIEVDRKEKERDEKILFSTWKISRIIKFDLIKNEKNFCFKEFEKKNPNN